MIDTIILAGGLGTRAAPYLGDLPKCLAPVGGRPLIHRLLDYLDQQGIIRTCLALAHGREDVLKQLGASYGNGLRLYFDLDYIQRGTGGAVVHVLTARLATDRPFAPPLLVLNGDTLLRLDLRRLYDAHITENDSYTTAVAGATPVARILGARAIDMLKKSNSTSLEAMLPVHRGVVLHCDPGCYVDIGTADGYARAQEWVKVRG